MQKAELVFDEGEELVKITKIHKKVSSEQRRRNSLLTKLGKISFASKTMQRLGLRTNCWAGLDRSNYLSAVPMSRFNRYDNDFTWLVDTGIAISVCNVDEPRYPLEVKSGKSCRRHSALSKALEIENYGIERAVVLHGGNVEVCGKVAYLPMYTTMVLD